MHTNTLLHIRPRKAKKLKAGQQAWRYLLLPLLIVALFSSCAVLPDPGPKLKTTPSVVTLQPIQAPHQSYRTFTVGFDISSSYPRSVFDQAKRTVADEIDRMVQPNEDGACVYINWITYNSWSPDSTAIPPIVIPALPADPPQPTLKPFPPLTGDPYQDAQAKRQVTEENAKTQQAYNDLLTQQHATLARVRAQVKQQTETLRHLAPLVDNISSDIIGMVERASQRLQGVQGTRVLLLASDMDNNNWSQWVAGDMHLTGVRIRVVFHYCPNAPECANNDAGWAQMFQTAGARDIRFLDPAQSLVVPNLFS